MSWQPNQDLKGVDVVPSQTAESSSPPNSENLNDKSASKRRNVNRSNNVRRDTDTVKDFTVTFEDIDNTILTHLIELKLSVLNEGHQRDVPVYYANPERWKSILNDGFMRDHKGQIQLPVVVIKRGSAARNDALKIFNRYGEHLSMPFIRKYSDKNAYDNFSVVHNSHKPVHEIHNVNLPDHYIISYQGIAWTDKVEQNNAIIERISYASEDYWGHNDGYKFRVTISDFDLQTEVSDSENRMVKTTFTMQVYAYLLPEYHKNWKKTTQKSFTPRKIVWTSEVNLGATKFDESYKFPR